MRPLRVLLSALLAAVAFAATAHGAPAPPEMLTPADGAEIPPRTGAVTFTVEGRAKERTNALHIQIFNGETTSDRTGRITGGTFSDFVLRQVGNGTTYAVTVKPKVIRRFDPDEILWRASRELPKRQCPRLKSGKRDCFQESKSYHTFTYRNAKPLDKDEPNDTPETAKGSLNSNCAYLETETDVDWVRLPVSPTAYNLTVELTVDTFTVFQPPSDKTTDVSAAVFAATDTATPLATQTVQRGDQQTLTVPAAANTQYLVRFAHGSPNAETYVGYEWLANVPGNDGTDCRL